MKKFLVLIIMVLLIFSISNAQKYNRGFIGTSPDTLAGADTNLYAFPQKITKYTGVVSFTYLLTNIEDQCNNIKVQGSQDNVTWIDVAIDATPTTDSTMQDENPNYLYYRLFTSTPAGDSVAFDAVNFVYKEE